MALSQKDFGPIFRHVATRRVLPCHHRSALLGPVGMARFLQQFDPGQGDYTAERSRILGNPSVDAVMDEIERRRTGPEPK
jgi:hypothetical protein